MDTEILKQPRGCLRVLQWVFALLAFACCSNFSTHLAFQVIFKEDAECDPQFSPASVDQEFSYPFRLDHLAPVVIQNFCKNNTKSPPISFPGDFSSDSQFFVFTGVVTWLYCTASLAVYVFFAKLYQDEQKKAPMIDFCVTVIIAVFWLAGSSAWANSLNGLKNASNSANWASSSKIGGPCFSSSGNFPDQVEVQTCNPTFTGSFGGANVSCIFGFLNFFLWACNLWYLYKETTWFKPGPEQANQPDINVESPSSN